MLKLVIVDDEPMERQAMGSYINWESMGIEVIGSACNGKQAIDVIMNMQPDIVISDVKMPVMDGLDMARKVKAIFPGIKIIFCSAYNEFEYVKNAINTEAFGYILKPVKDDELFRIIKSAADKCIKEKYENNKIDVLKKQVEENISLLKERTIKDILFNRDMDESCTKLSHSWLRGFTGLMIVLALKADEGCEQKIVEVERIITEEINKFEKSLFVHLKENGFVIVICIDTTFLKDVDSIVRQLAAGIKDKLSNKLHIDVIQGYSYSEGSIERLPELYREAERAVYYNTLFSAGEILNIKDIKTLGSKNEDKSSQIDDKFYISLRNEDIEQANSILESYFDEILKTREISLHYIQANCIRVMNDMINVLKDMGYQNDNIYINGTFPWEELLNMHRIPDIKVWMKNTVDAIIGFLDKNKKDKNSRIVYEVKSFLSEHYYNPLSLDSIAEKVNLTPNYLSKIFKEKTGISLVEYIKDIRIRKSIELLSDISINIYEIAKRVGFDDTSYFCTVFKKTIGLTPSQYREKISI